MGKDSVTVGGVDNTVETTGEAAVVVGGIYNKAAGTTSAVVGGSANDAIGNESAIFGGFNNDATGTYATISGGSHNRTYGDITSVFGGSMNNAVGSTSSVFGGSINTATGTWSSVIGGSHNTALGLSSTAVGGENAIVDGTNSVGVAGGSTNADYALAAGNEATVTVDNGTAIGYQATANKEGTVAFGHDKGDVHYTSIWPQKATEKDGKYYDAKNEEITKDQYEALRNADLTFNDYSQKPTVTENKYGAAAYNRLVKVADGVDAHDVVVMEQLTKATNDLTKDLSVNAGWGINVNDVTTKNDDGTETTTKNVISLNRNLGTNSGNTKAKENGRSFNGKVSFEAKGKNSLILGGEASTTYDSNVTAGTDGDYSVLVGGYNNSVKSAGKRAVVAAGSYNKASGENSAVIGGSYNQASGDNSVVIGGGAFSDDQGNQASGQFSTIIGGDGNKAKGINDVVSGGYKNITSGDSSFIGGGQSNKALGYATAILGGAYNMGVDDTTVVGGQLNLAVSNGAFAAGGSANQVAGFMSAAIGGEKQRVIGNYSTAIGGASTGIDAEHATAIGSHAVVTSKNGLALGYKATADKEGTISFGHDKGDVSGYESKIEYGPYDYYSGEVESYISGGDARSVVYTPTYYESAEYNRLVKVDDGIDAHDAVVMEQLKPYTKSDASNVGANLKTYTVGDDGETITETDATADQKKDNKDDWGKALGAEPFTTGTSDAATNASTSDQLVTGKTLYNYDAPVAETGKKLNYVSANNTTGQNLSALDAQVKANSAKADKASTSHTALTVEGNTPAGKGKDEKTKEDVYAGKNILLHESTDENGKVTYDLKLAKDISIGKPGKNGEDGKIGIDGRDGHIGLNGSDGITVRGLDGKDGKPGEDGVTITGPKGADGTDGKVGISGKNGKDAVSISGKNGVGHIGLTGPAGTNGKDGASIDITVKNGYDGANGVNGKNGVDGTSLTRIVYTDGAGEHQVATMEDGMKYAGDDAQTDTTKVIAKKLNNTLDIIGGAKGDLTEGNIGVNSTDKGQLKVQLAKDLKGITSISNQTTTKDGNKDVTTGAKITLGTDGTTTITGGDINVGGNKVTNIKSALDGAKDAEGKDATIATATGDALKNAANLGDLQKVYNDINTKAENASTSHTALTVEGNTPAGKGKDEKTKEDVYAGKNILLHESTDENGKVTYDLKLAKDISIGKPGKNGEDGKIGIDGRDGHIGLNGSDGITVRGLDGKDGAPGKDGVTITGPKGEAGKHGIDGKVGISGKDGNDAVSISGKDGVGHIGLTGPAGTNGIKGTDGQPGTSIDITVKNGYDEAGKDGKDGINGKNGVDGTSLTRIVYTDGAGEHQVATMEDGLKFKGDDGTEIAKKLNNTMEIIGGADSTKLTDKNIGVNSDGDKLKVQLSKDLTGMNSTTYTTTTGEGESATTSTTVVNGNGLTITDGPSITNKGIDGGNKVITNVGSGIKTDANGKYTVTDQNKGNAANIGDVQNMVNEAKTELTDGANGLNNKANVDASNIGSNITVTPIYQKDKNGQDVIGQNGQKVVDQKATEDAQKAARTANETAWGSAIGTGKIEKDNGQLVTGKTVYDEVRPKEDGNYVKTNQTTGVNLSALDSKIGKLDANGNYIQKDASVSSNLNTLDTQVKANADAISKEKQDREAAITNITNNIGNLSDSAVKYDADTNKTKITLAGEGGTTITNVKDGALSEKSSDAVNGKQLYNEQKAREEADKAITENVTNNTNEITKIKNGEGFTNTGKTIIKNLSKDAVQVKAGDRIKVDEATDEKTGNKTYTISANNNGTVVKGDTGLISGDTLYKEVHVDKDGSYIKGSQTVGQNLSALDSGLKTTSDLIHTNTEGDTIQIGGSSTATKIDVRGKDKDGKSTGRIITGVVTDASDPTSAANVGYVNGVTAANTQQIYRDMNNAYGRLNNNINKAAAGSNALAALHPLDYDPDDKADFAVGYGHYRNANAAALGAFYHPNENTMVNVGVSLGNGDPGFNAGVSFKVGRGGAGRKVMSRTEMAKVINSQSKEIDALKKDNADKDKRIDALEQKMAEILAKLDKNGK